MGPYKEKELTLTHDFLVFKDLNYGKVSTRLLLMVMASRRGLAHVLRPVFTLRAAWGYT